MMEVKMSYLYLSQCHLLYILLYIGETVRRLGDRFREHLRDVKKDDKNASKLFARPFNLPNHSKQHVAVCGLSPHQGSTESRKTLQQKFVFQIGTLNPHGINERDRYSSYFMITLTMYRAGVGNANRITVINWRLLF